MKFFTNIVLLGTLMSLVTLSSFGQETETKVVDEVVAQVNEGVITLSRVKRETKEIVDGKVQTGMNREEAQKQVDEKQGELIANLINEELLIQRAKELGLDKDIDESINQRYVEIMKQQNIKTIPELEEKMRSENIDPQEMREVWRKQLTRERVIQREVQNKLYWSFNGKQLKDYYEKNKAKFTKQETVSLSELYLAFAGRDEAAVREKAKALVSQIRGGADFGKLAAENSERPNAAKTKGKADTVPVKELDPKFAVPLKDLKADGVTDPIEVDGVGLIILRVDERKAASTESEFSEEAVRLELMRDGIAGEQKKFMTDLRENSFIKISEFYRPAVSPILFADERKAKPGK